MADEMSIDNKPDHPRRDESEDSPESSPEREQSVSATASGSGTNPVEDFQQPKRKGGRKPIYATSEERKQRNRQAQAAFRERRSEYIKHLEDNIRRHETTLQNLQSAHANAMEQCMMLRYKNSLLERILVEKDIDVQAELQAKPDCTNLGPSHDLHSLAQPTHLHRPIMSRSNRNRKSTSSIPQSLEAAPASLCSASQARRPATSPRMGLTPSSHSNSPSTVGSHFSPAPSDSVSIRGSIVGLPRQPSTVLGGTGHAPSGSILQFPTPRSSVASAGASLYSTPSLQAAIGQLEQEFDEQADITGECKLEALSGSSGFGAVFHSDTGQPLLLSPTSTCPPHPFDDKGGHHASVSDQLYPPPASLVEHQRLDWGDPFGLSASMAFPGQPFQFDQSSMR